MYRSLFPGGLFAEVDRLQREMQQAFDSFSPSIRGFARGYPALNVGSTPTSVEIYAFAPGIDPAKIEVNLERGVLIEDATGITQYADLPGCAQAPTERARRRRDAAARRRTGHGPDKVNAEFSQGVLRLRIPKADHAQPRRIAVQVA